MSVVEDDGAPAERLSALEEFRRAPGAFIRQRPHLPLVPLVLVVFVLVWEGIVQAWRIPEFLVPAPSAIGRALAAGLTSGLYLDHFGVTLYESLLGFLIAAAAGIACGTVIAQFRVVEQTLYPYLVALQTLPKIAIAPLLIVWLGFGITSKVVIAALVAFFPILVNVIVGLKTVDASKLDLMRSLDASRWQTFRYVTFPNALPFVFAGLDIAIVFSVARGHRRRVRRLPARARQPDPPVPHLARHRRNVRGPAASGRSRGRAPSRHPDHSEAG